MNFTTISPDKRITLFIKDILIFEEVQKARKTVLPFFADGYPGLMFQDAENGLSVSPHNKKMPTVFLYGQTIKPIELHIEGCYKLIVFRLYPFVLKRFFNITAKDINDGCYDLQQTKNGNNLEKEILKGNKIKRQIEIISNFLLAIFQSEKEKLDLTIRQSIQIILDNKAQINIKQLCGKLSITERTFERRFLKEVGITAKQFIQITRFQQSLEQLTVKDFVKLTDIVYSNGFADQSHFIRVFKSFTGKSPKSFMAEAG